MNFDPTPYNPIAALTHWALVMAALFGSILLIGLIVSLIGNGKRGPSLFLKQILSGLKDFVTLSPRRVYALSQLTFREAVRRKALLVFVVFAILFMFGGWFLSNSNARPELQVKVYLKFVLTAINWLVLLVMLLLACWGLPADIKDRSLHTVVTKPVRRNEVILGRILGYTAVGTLVLVVMSVIGYVWVQRQVPESVQEQLTSRIPVYGQLYFTTPEGDPVSRGVNVGDIWEFRSAIQGSSDASAIWSFEVGEDPENVLQPDGTLLLESHFEAFRTHKGTMGKGLYVQYRIANRLRRDFAWSVGLGPQLLAVRENLLEGQFNAAGETLNSLATQLDENTLKSVPEPVTQDPSQPNPPPQQSEKDITLQEYALMSDGFGDARYILDYLTRYMEKHEQDASWTEGLLTALEDCQEKARDAFEALNSEKPVTDQIRQALAESFRNFANQLQEHSDQLGQHLIDKVASPVPFELQEFKGNLTTISREQSYPVFEGEQKSSVDAELFDDLVRDGRLSVEVFCLDPGQFLSMARPDLFIRTPDNPFYSGYFKSILGTWLMMLMVVVIGVTASSFVKGPVATLLTLTLVGLGSFARDFLAEVASGRFLGGGPVENYYRIIKQMNPQVPLQPGLQTDVIKGLDEVLVRFLTLIKGIIPDFSYVNQMPAYVQNGFDVPWNASLLPSLAIAFGIVIPCLIIGHFSMKLREIESK